MNKKQTIQLAFYGDDFTGSTDALEFLCRAGARAVLFIDVPTGEQLQAYQGIDAFGVAGVTRSLPPEEMESILLPAFKKMKATGARHVHYKVCSTFDSSPSVGSIGKAIDCGAAIFDNKTIPVLGGMPALGRYCVFGNLFAVMGIGSNGKIHRLDRHPSMSKHPVTPADESDLRLLLAKQTNKTIGLIDVLQLDKAVDDWQTDDEDIILLDALHEDQLLKIGEWLENQTQSNSTLFSVGSSGIELALGKYWNRENLLQPLTSWHTTGKADPLLVVSGSCSPVTASQIAYAKSIGFKEIIIDAEKIASANYCVEEVMKDVNELLEENTHVIVHTGKKKHKNLSAEKLGTALGQVAKCAAEKKFVKRVLVAGGDTSSYAARAMEIEAVEMVASLVSGAPLCKAISSNKNIHDLEVNFKGGQVGSENYFEVLMNGTLN